MSKNIFYLREIEGSIDSAMSLQVINDYGYLAKRNSVCVPVNYSAKDTLKKYINANFEKTNFVVLKLLSKNKYLRRFQIFFHIIMKLRKIDIIVIRERKHLVFAEIMKKFNILLVSELHEGGLPFYSEFFDVKFQLFLKKLDGILFTTPAQIQHLEKHNYVIPNNYCTLPNGVNIDKLSKAICKSKNDSNHAIIITYTGQFTSWKNIPLLFASMQLLPQNYRLRLAGGKIKGSSEEYISRLSVKYNVSSRVDYIGFVQPGELVKKVINGSSVLVVPLSDHPIAKYATSPMKLVEYMATKIPIVAVGHPSVTALTTSEAVHLSTTDPKDFSNAIINAVEEISSEKEKRIKNANFLAQYYCHEIRAKKYNEWLTTILSKA